MQGVSWIDGSRIKSSDPWDRTESQHIYVTFVLGEEEQIRPKEDENEPPPKGGKAGPSN
jgi:hypothetical protein